MSKFGTHIAVDKDGILSVEGVSTIELVENFGTPLFVVSENTIRENYRAFKRAFQSRYPNDVVVCVGMKANWGLAVRRVIVEEGGGGDAFGLGELYVVLLAGTLPDKIVINGPNKPEVILRAAIEIGAMINVDDLDELEKVGRIAEVMEKPAKIAPRIRLPLKALSGKRYIDPRYAPPGTDIAKWVRENKFGMEPDTFFQAVEKAMNTKRVELKGVMYHGGIPRRAGFYREEMEELMDYVEQVRERFTTELEVLNVGGGFVPFRDGQEPPPSLEDYAEGITSIIKDRCRSLGIPVPRLFLEPGRYCWENAVIWLTRVGTIKVDKTLAGKKWVYVDGSINEMKDPFDPFGGFHQVVIANNVNRGGEETVDICGQLCNAADILAGERRVPKIEKEDILAFLGMGAYNESFADQSNAMPRSASIMVSNGKKAVVRRRETIQDVLGREAIPHWLFKREG
jgi:diaminopimelate decarboxylase